MDRRDFVKAAVAGAAALVLPVVAVETEAPITAICPCGFNCEASTWDDALNAIKSHHDEHRCEHEFGRQIVNRQGREIATSGKEVGN